ncbi:MAG: TonB-dependent receptor [Breznakibacter sp.]
MKQIVRITLLLWVFTLGATLRTQAQTNTSLKGVVYDERTKQPLTGVAIRVKGTATGTVTGLDGKFDIALKQELPVSLVVSFLGYKTQEIEFYEIDAVDIYLTEDINLVNSVVVIGYGTQKRTELTGAIASVNASDLNKGSVSSFDKALQGQISGVTVVPTSGQPGGATSIRIRGGSSITGGNEPLYVIDGFPVYNTSTSASTISGSETSPLANINPGDIESIDVLKDASATAIYGSRGSNGVVIITTKKGKADKSTISYEGSQGVQWLSKKIDVLGAKDFAQLRNDALYDAYPSQGPYQYLTPEQIAALGDGVDWQDAAFRKAGVSSHQVSFAGGSEKNRYAVVASYYDQKGILANTDFKRFTGRINLDNQLTKRLKTGTYVTGTKSHANVAPSGIVSSLLIMPPTATIYEADGSYTLRNPFENIISNPIASLKERTNNSDTYRVLANFFADLEVAKGLNLKISGGADINQNKENSYIPSSIYEGLTIGGQAQIGVYQSFSWLNENTLTYNKVFGQKHFLDVVAGFTQQEFESEIVRAGSQQFVSDDLTYNSLGSGNVALTPYSYAGSWGLVSYLSRVGYNYAQKYYVSASIRADGSSRFGKNNKWGYFPSAAVSWKISNEDFFKPYKSIVNDLKLRASYGSTGNQEIGNYQSLSTLTSVKYLFDDNLVTGFVPGNIANDDLGWETTNQYDLGIDLALYNNRVVLNFDTYYKKTVDLLLNVEIPWTTGQSTSLQNYGSLQNKGYEINLSTKNVDGNFKWGTTLNFAVNRNEVLSIGDDSSDSYISGNYIVKVGQPLGTYYGTVTDGILQAGEEAAKGAYTGNATPKAGDRLYKDISGDGSFTTAADRDIIGSAQPDFTFGIRNDLSWKGFDLSFFFQGTYGNEILNGNKQSLELFNGQQNASTSALNRYTSENPSTTIPRAKLDPAPVFSDRFIEDGSFLKLRNVTLGYNLPKALLGRVNLAGARVFVTGNNLLTITNYTGFDPEVTSGDNTVSQGTDSGIYPVASSYAVGISLTF